MKNLEKYNNVFMNSLKVDIKALHDLKSQEVSTWDSLDQMHLISGLEEAFDIMFDMVDIIDFKSYRKGIEILKKYNIEIIKK
jgi:acyl carrier protein